MLVVSSVLNLDAYSTLSADALDGEHSSAAQLDVQLNVQLDVQLCRCLIEARQTNHQANCGLLMIFLISLASDHSDDQKFGSCWTSTIFQLHFCVLSLSLLPSLLRLFHHFWLLQSSPIEY